MPRTALSAPLGVWSVEANDARVAAMGGAAALATIAQTLSPITHHFRRDLLAFCKAARLLPHPQLLPFHPDEEDPTTNGELLTPGSAGGVGTVVWDLAEIDTLQVKNWRLDDGSFAGLCIALQHCPTIHTLIFFNVQLKADQVETLCKLIPQTSVTRFHLDWNTSLQSDGDDNVTCFPPSALSDLLASTSTVSTLSLRRCGLTAAHAVAIAQALQTNSSSRLELLNLFDNPMIGDDGATALAYALPFTTSLQSLSLGNTSLSGVAARVLVDVLCPKYVAPPALLKMLQDAEPRIQAELDAAKKAKKKLDRMGAIHNLGLPVLETIDGVPHAVGNATVQDLFLSGNDLITQPDVLAMDAQLHKHHHAATTASPSSSLTRIRLQRIPALKALAGQHSLSTILHL